jgi:hypothetical protein
MTDSDLESLRKWTRVWVWVWEEVLAWDASGYEDYADFVAFNDVWLQFILKYTHVGIGTYHYAGSETNHALWVLLNKLNLVGQLVEGRKKK